MDEKTTFAVCDELIRLKQRIAELESRNAELLAACNSAIGIANYNDGTLPKLERIETTLRAAIAKEDE